MENNEENKVKKIWILKFLHNFNIEGCLGKKKSIWNQTVNPVVPTLRYIKKKKINKNKKYYNLYTQKAIRKELK